MKDKRKIPTRTLVVGALVASTSFAIGAGAMHWKNAADWGDWFINFNMLPMLSEQTHALKYIRENKTDNLQSELDDSVWRHIEMHAKRKTEGIPLPENAQRDVSYLCSHIEKSITSPAAKASEQRKSWCASLLNP